MNINPKFQQPGPSLQLQQNIQAQQILLQQLQQPQLQQPPQVQSQFDDGKSMYNNYQRQVNNNQFFPQQFAYQQPPQPPQSQQSQQPPQPPQFNYQSSQQLPPQPPQPPFQSVQGQVQSVQGQGQTSVQGVQGGQPVGQVQVQPGPKQTNSQVDNPSLIHWQHQQQLCQISRQANIPHYYARQYAANSRKTKNPYSDNKPINLLEATKTVVALLEEQEKSMQKITTPTANPALLYNKKTVNYYEDDTVYEEERMRNRTNGQQLWCQLDLSGQGIANLSPKLFNYDFLESLYLNNNKLTVVPSMISKLRGLRTLDLSQNKIEEVPNDLGLCYNLRYLYLFDNNIRTLPNGFGNLIELLFLGIEGNPLDPVLTNLLAEKGSKELIIYLRDLPPVLPKPKPRKWILLEDDGEIIDETTTSELETSPDTFTVMSYNTLCQHYATTRMHKYTPLWALDWEYRKPLLYQEIVNLNTDIICMQEVETRTFHEYWVPKLAGLGYKGLFYNKTRSKTMSQEDALKVDGCAVFFKVSKFDYLQRVNFEFNSACMGSDKYKKTKDLFNRFMNKDNVALVVYLQHKETGEKICVINTHLHWDPMFNDVKTLQVGVILEELKHILKKFNSSSTLDDIKNSSIIFCGDFNSTIDSAVYQLFSTGSVKHHKDIDGYDYGKFTEDGFKNVFKLKSAYSTIGELPFTNCTPDFTTAIDYIWFTPTTLQVKGVLGKVDEDYAKHVIGFPDANFQSDHIPIVSKFQIKKSGSTKRADFKPDFKSGASRKT